MSINLKENFVCHVFFEKRLVLYHELFTNSIHFSFIEKTLYLTKAQDFRGIPLLIIFVCESYKITILLDFISKSYEFYIVNNFILLDLFSKFVDKLIIFLFL